MGIVHYIQFSRIDNKNIFEMYLHKSSHRMHKSSGIIHILVNFYSIRDVTNQRNLIFSVLGAIDLSPFK
jgi:hypothetical protein